MFDRKTGGGSERDAKGKERRGALGIRLPVASHSIWTRQMSIGNRETRSDNEVTGFSEAETESGKERKWTGRRKEANGTSREPMGGKECYRSAPNLRKLSSQT